MKRRFGPAIALSIVVALVAAGAAEAQGRGGPNWTTTGGDAQRTAWVKTDPRISSVSVQKPSFQLLWKSKLENQPRHLESLTQPMLMSNIISYKGFKASPSSAAARTTSFRSTTTSTRSSGSGI